MEEGTQAEDIAMALSFVRPLLREQRPLDVLFDRWGLDRAAVRAAVNWLRVNEGIDDSYLAEKENTP